MADTIRELLLFYKGDDFTEFFDKVVFVYLDDSSASVGFIKEYAQKLARDHHWFSKQLKAILG